MKRSHDPTNWRRKLDDEGLQYIETYRKQKLEAQGDERKQHSASLLDDLVAKVSATSKKPDDYKKYVDDLRAENPRAADEFESSVRTAMSQYTSLSIRELWKIIALTFEAAGPQGRRSIALPFAIISYMALGTYQRVKQRHFGNAEISPRDFYWVIGTALQEIGATFRGDSTPTTKGRVNTELLQMIQNIRDHEKEKLTYRELKEALEYVFIYQDEDSLKLFVHRARKRKWL